MPVLSCSESKDSNLTDPAQHIIDILVVFCVFFYIFIFIVYDWMTNQFISIPGIPQWDGIHCRSCPCLHILACGTWLLVLSCFSALTYFVSSRSSMGYLVSSYLNACWWKIVQTMINTHTSHLLGETQNLWVCWEC